MGGNESTLGGDRGPFGNCCEARDRNRDGQNGPPVSAQQQRLCGVGMGLDSQMLAQGKGAVVTCLAKGGPAERNGAVQIGDRIVSVDDLDVEDLLNDPGSGRYDVSKGVSTVLANALLGEAGSMVSLGIVRKGHEGVIMRKLPRAPLKPQSQWISAISDD